ncbi:MAG: DUF2088 domain-containing protein [Planctomycetes bacterium]|nr:DUF2088 domain-containing protein [Planctomycetota bacterium]
MQTDMPPSWRTIGPKAPDRTRESPATLSDVIYKSSELQCFLAEASDETAPIIVVINDSHRATPTRQILQVLSEHLRRSGRANHFHALVATGTHRFSETHRRHFESATFDECGLRFENISWHDAEDASNLIANGNVRVNRLVAESRFLLPIGSVEPHYFAGTTGAHKTVTIGCLSIADIERNHAGAMRSESEIMRLDGNPVFDDMVSILDRLRGQGRRILAINTIVIDGRIVSAKVGDPLKTLHAFMPVVEEMFVHRIDSPVDVLRLKVPPPLDQCLYQADKALKNSHLAVRDGGGIILEAVCPEGIGPDGFMNLLRRAPDYESTLEIVRKDGYCLGDHKAAKLRYLTDPKYRNVKVALVSRGVSPTDAEQAGLRPFETVDGALNWLREAAQGPHEKGLIVEDAGVVSVTVA